MGRIPIHFNTTQGGVSDVYIGVFVKKSSSVGVAKVFIKKFINLREVYLMGSLTSSLIDHLRDFGINNGKR